MYKNKDLSPKERAEHLLGQMTVEEKVAQLTCAMTVALRPENMKEQLGNGMGTISCLNSSLSGDMEKDLELLRSIQEYLVENTRLGIPALIHSEGIAGAQIPMATAFPQSLGMAATFDPDLMREVAEVVKNQLLAFGYNSVHSPLFDVATDPRWGRIGETYGESPYLVAEMGVAFVEGVQGDDEIMSAAKHFVGYGNAEGGRNGGAVEVGERKLFDTYCLPFEAAIKKGKVKSVMNAYGLVNGEPAASSGWLLTDILRGKLGFDGPVVADYGSVAKLISAHHTARDNKDAAIQCVTAGLDVEQPNGTCYSTLTEAVQNGEIDERVIDTACLRVLRVKFELGLFENAYGKGGYIEEVSKSESKELALKAAEKTVVMLKNEGILPLSKGKKIALIGPHGDSAVGFFGGYSSVGTAATTSGDFDRSEMDSYVKTAYAAMTGEYKEHTMKRLGISWDDQPSAKQKQMIIESIKKSQQKSGKTYKDADEFLKMFYPDCFTVKQMLEREFGRGNIIFVQGCGIKTPIDNGIEEAVGAVREADVVVAMLGGKESMRASDATCGENKDNSDIGLEKVQNELMDAIFAEGKPVISVIVDGRPLAVEGIVRRSEALLYAWLPGEMGAEAIVNVISGKVNPSGKLPVTLLRDSGQINMYNERLSIYAEDGCYAEYIEGSQNEPLFPFGFGLSYTQFSYSGLTVSSQVETGEKIDISFTVANSGDRDGIEISQIYAQYLMSSVARPVRMLCGFATVSLKAGESKTVLVSIDTSQLAFHDREMKLAIEPTTMKFFIGSSSLNTPLSGNVEIVGEKVYVNDREFFSNIKID